MGRELEIRKLQPKNVYDLVQILEFGDGWKKLLAIIPKSIPGESSEFKYTFEHYKMIEQAGINQRRSCSEILLEEWSTSGRSRPNLSHLLELLLKAELFRAAEYVAVNLLNEPSFKWPETDSATNLDISEDAIQNILNAQPEKRIQLLRQPNSKSDEEKILVNFSEDHNESLEKIQKVVLPDKHHDERIVIVINENRMQEEFSEVVHGANLIFGSQENGPLYAREVQSTSNRENAGGMDVSNSSSFQLNTSLPHFSYAELETCTANFCEDLLVSRHRINEGRKLGTGAFGSVYLGVYPTENYVAVKKLKRDVINIEKQFRNEVEALSRYQHPNLLPLLGYSCDGPAYCLVYEFMSNGSLQERLACQDSTPVLPWETRLEIALGTSQGILYLHTAYEKPLIHRDIKSANILLDQNFAPKLGDFGLVRLGSSGQQSHSTALTSTVFGTSAYMAPEAFRGDISVKLDSFSFGVVILELLTSLSPYDENREGWDLVTHVEDICCEGRIEPLLDTKAGLWCRSDTVEPAEALYSIALDCLKEKRLRPEMDSVVRSLQNVLSLSP